jgi:hypothetical protein
VAKPTALRRFRLFNIAVSTYNKGQKMYKSITSLLVAVLIVSFLAVPNQTVYAQISLPAEINKSFSPISIAAGGTSRLSVTIFNPNGFALTNAAWADNLVGVQPGLTIASPAGVTNSCGGSVTATAGSTTLSLSGGTVPAQVGTTPGRCTVSVNVTSSTAGNLINTIPAGALSSTGGGTTISNTTPASATLNVTGSPTPTVSKSFSPTSIWAGQTSQLSIVIRNNELGRTLTQVSLTDNLPTNVFLANPVNLGNTCGGTVTATPGGTTVVLSNGSIPPNSSCVITVDVTSDVQGSYVNRIPPNALGTQQGVTNSTAATLIITLQNPTGSPYTGVNFTDNLPTPMTVVSGGTVTNTCGGTVSTTATSATLSGGTIPAGTPASPGTCTI